ncbi:MAG: NTP transferase domain-containing protein [Ruminococcus sp.]|nr:NTP transferase domain-containing protein [Ruminococcus sp.]
MYSAILLSGGKGKRVRKEIPKQYLLLAGKPIIMHSLERIDKLSEVEEIIIVCEKKYEQEISQMAKQYMIEKPLKFVQNGETRQESVYQGLLKTKSDNVLIHEAARPFAVLDDYRNLIKAEKSNAILGCSIPYTVLKGQKYVKDILNRAELVNVQLPQKFIKSPLLEAHKKARKECVKFTEDASLLFYYDKTDIEIVNGSSFNIKITEPMDLIMGEKIYYEYIARRK